MNLKKLISKAYLRSKAQSSISKGDLKSHSKLLTVILTYYNQVNVLEKQVKYWLDLAGDVTRRITFLIVDDGSEKSAAEAVKHVPNIDDLSLQIFRIHEDKYCNIGGARNLGSLVAFTEWILHTDVDIVLREDALRRILQIIGRDKRKIHRFNRQYENGSTKIHPGTMLLPRSLYWEVGGCDEDFVGNYGQTDVHFIYRAKKIVPVKTHKNIMLGFRSDGETKEIDRSKLVPNEQLFMEKMATGSWSSDFFRFTWSRVK